MTEILIPVSPGDLLDRLTILRIKAARLGDRAQRANVIHERDLLERIADRHIRADPAIEKLTEELTGINGDLWDVEDDLRGMEDRGDFGAGFIALARSVYQLNDERAALKRRINLRLGSSIIEEKSYGGNHTAH